MKTAGKINLGKNLYLFEDRCLPGTIFCERFSLQDDFHAGESTTLLMNVWSRNFTTLLPVSARTG